jgi:glycosyltransferase involved in cell wall biosynthesis
MSPENNTTSPPVCILMATYNGAVYLECQLESILNQTFQNWELLIRDDGSTDTTIDIVEQYCAKDSRIKQIDRIGLENEGPRENFKQLLNHALEHSANLFMFCDQDDYWHPDKIQKYLDQSAGEDAPCLIYSDIELVDSRLEPLSTPYCFEPATDVKNKAMLTSLLSLSHIPGCSIAINRALAEIANPIPDVAIMHDWWLALAAAACGKLLFIDEKLIKYRQHSEDTVGVTSVTQLLVNVKQWPTLWHKGSTELCMTMQQAKELTKRIEQRNSTDPELFHQLKRYTSITGSGLSDRLKIASQLGLRQGRGTLRFVLYLRLLFLNCER